MGIDVQRFHGEVDEELFCPICSAVLEDPLQAESCEHAFCRNCITTWLQQAATCPVDREPLRMAALGPPPRILRNLLARLMISCDNHSYGCEAVVRLDGLLAHIQECQHNPSRLVPCLQGCGLSVPQNELTVHKCVQALRSAFDEHQLRLEALEKRDEEREARMASMELALQETKDALAALLAEPSSSSAISSSSVSTDELQAWARTLPRARVTRWGGMISTPDAVLQSAIRRSLMEAGCPFAAIPTLLERAHEREWPRGLQSLEVRQNNRSQYVRYACRRILNRQAVLILASENQHMPTDLVVEPALVIIFANGVE